MPAVDSPQATTFQQRKKDNGYFKFVDVGEDSDYKDYCLKYDSGKAMLRNGACDNESTKKWKLHDSGELTYSFPTPQTECSTPICPGQCPRSAQTECITTRAAAAPPRSVDFRTATACRTTER